MSKLEEHIYTILKKGSNVTIKREVTFQELKRKQNLRYDFGIYNKKNQLIALIEVQGQQHYEYTPHFHNSRQAFLKQQEYDRIKISYCLAHNIPLYCIPYTDVFDITHFEQCTNRKYRVYSKWHNDIHNPKILNSDSNFPTFTQKR